MEHINAAGALNDALNNNRPRMDTLPQLYRKQMIEVKRRLIAIDRILGAKKGKPRTLTEDYDNEFMWLQLRKVVELVAFSAIAADKERYVALRLQQNANSNYQNDWRAEKILGHLSNINPEFLPQACGQMKVHPDGTKHFEGLASEAESFSVAGTQALPTAGRGDCR